MTTTILNFHGIGPQKRTVEPGEHSCWLEEEAMESILDIVRGLEHVSLTVDDGNDSDFAYLLPALQRRGLKGTFFVCSDRIDQPAFLSRHQLREIADAGMTVGSHGAAHLSWRNLGDNVSEKELGQSKVAIEAACGKPVDTAACPFGAYDGDVLKKLRRFGYRCVYTSDGGTCNDRQYVKARTTLTRAMSIAEIEGLATRGRGAFSQAVIDAKKWFKRVRSS